MDVVVIPGPYDVQRDKAGAPCASCGQEEDCRSGRVLVPVAGVLLMLCIDGRACLRRVRRNA